MTWKSVSELLTEQFYQWELRGRGVDLWPEPVTLEPAFRPFLKHFVPYRPIVDDGRRPTFLSQFADQLLGRPTIPPAPSVAIEELPEPEPRAMADDDGLLTFDIHLPADEVVRPELVQGVLSALRVTRYPITWEIVGTGEGILVQLVLRESDAALVRSTLSNAFPRMNLAAASDRFQDFAFAHDEHLYGIVELTLAREFMVPLPAPKSFDPDPLVGIVAAMEDLDHDEFALVQILFQGAGAPWAESIYRAVTDDEGDDFFANAPGIATLGKKKALQPLCGVAVRLVIAGPDARSIDRRLPRFAAAFQHYSAPDRNALVPIDDEASPHRESDVLYRRSHRSGMLLGVDELATLVHPPSASVRSPRLLERFRRTTRALGIRPATGVAVGENHHAGAVAEVLLSDADLRRHVHVIGASGSGKSNFLLHALRNAADEGYGFALIDPHGDLADDFLSMLPASRSEDLVILDAADPESPIGLNVLSAPTDLERTLLGSDLVAVFRRLSTSWGDQMHTVFANAIQAFLESPRGGTLADLRRFLVEDSYRRLYLTSVADEHVVYYWQREFPLLKGRPEAPILTRLEGFLRAKLVRRIVAGGRADLDFRRMMDEGGIFVAKLAHGAIGEENAALLGSLLVAKLHQVALSRQASRDRRTFLVAIDEFQHFVTPSMAALLSGARKFGLALVLVHQDLRQVESRDREVSAALLANAGTRIVFRTSDTDARTLADGFAHFTADDVRMLPVGQAIARIGGADRDFNLEVPLVVLLSDLPAQLRSRPRFLLTTAHEETAERSPAAPSPISGTPHTESRPSTRSPARRMEEPPLLGRGGPQHKYLQNVLKSFAEARGFHATIEKQVEGGSIDVFLERETGSIACEISVDSTVEYEIRNAEKCLRAGAEHVLMVVVDPRRRESLATALSRPRVTVATPEEAIAWIAAHAPAAANRVAGYSVRVNYVPGAEDTTARTAAIAKVLAQSLRRLNS